jgi:hypothetical protein
MSPNSARSTPPTSSSHECVVYLTRNLDSGCIRGRLRALLATAGKQRSVVVLHSRSSVPNASVVASLGHSANLRLAPQPEVDPQSRWALFGAKMVGYSKAAVLLWLLRNGSHCRQMWQIEDDVFFTGAWHRLFDAYANDSSDMVGKTFQLPPPGNGTPVWANERNCATSYETPCRAGQAPLQVTTWPLLRISRALAHEVNQVLTVRRGSGFHEALMAPVCERAPWCSIAPFRPEHVGWMETGHTAGPNSSKREQTLKLQLFRSGLSEPASVRRVWHPAKCVADPLLGSKARSWASVRTDSGRTGTSGGV